MQMYLSIVAGGGFELVGAGVTVTGGGVGEGGGVSALVGVGAGVTGAPEQEAHQHFFPRFPHPSG